MTDETPARGHRLQLIDGTPDAANPQDPSVTWKCFACGRMFQGYPTVRDCVLPPPTEE